MVNYKNISFFKGLNGLRFFAAFLVVMHHAETIRLKNGLANLQHIGLFRNGDNAVTFFFVLSGFLITYLLLKEHDYSKTISIRNFYIKRVLRIWPLYFLLVTVGTLIMPFLFNALHINYTMPYHFSEVWYYFLFFLPGLVTFFFGHHLLEPLWSIGIEEVFYLIWAPLFKFGRKYIFHILWIIIAIKSILILLSTFYVQNDLFIYLVNIFRFEAMAVGGLGAWFIFNRKTPVSKSILYKKPLQVAIYGLLLAYLIFYTQVDFGWWKALFHTPLLSGLLVDVLFLYLIIGVSLASNNIFTLDNKILNYLGEISYGIYMYHLIVIFGIIQVLKDLFSGLHNPLNSIAFYVITCIGVLGISSISKILFENYFLRLKNKF